VRIAQHIDMIVADRLYRAMHDRAAQANAEYRFIDLMDRYVFVIAFGCVVVAALYLGAAEVLVRGVDHLVGPLAAEHAITLAWIGLFLLLPACLGGMVLMLCRRAMGARWWRSEPRLPPACRPAFSSGVRTRAGPGPIAVWLAAVGVTVVAGYLPMAFLICLALACAGTLLFVVYSKLARQGRRAQSRFP
jgi:hypothetical protein